MSDLFSLLFFTSLIYLIISFFRADLFYKLFNTKEKKKVILIWLLIAFASIILIGVFSDENLKDDKTAQLENRVASLENQLKQEQAKNTKTSAKIPASAPISTYEASSSGIYACNCSKTCAQMSSCVEAQYQLDTCGCSRRDADNDGIACDADCQ